MNEKTKEKIKCALIRAAQTFAEAMLAMLTMGTAIQGFDWPNIISVSATAAVISLLKSFAVGMPEVTNE